MKELLSNIFSKNYRKILFIFLVADPRFQLKRDHANMKMSQKFVGLQRIYILKNFTPIYLYIYFFSYKVCTRIFKNIVYPLDWPLNIFFFLGPIFIRVASQIRLLGAFDVFMTCRSPQAGVLRSASLGRAPSLLLGHIAQTILCLSRSTFPHLIRRHSYLIKEAIDFDSN